MTTIKARLTSFPIAVAALLECGAHIRRNGWRNNFHLELEAYGTYNSEVIVRVSDTDGTRNPWAVITEDDTMAQDWEIIMDTGDKPVPDDFTPSMGTYAHALNALLNGAQSIRMTSGWHPSMEVRLVDGKVMIEEKVIEMGKVMVLRLPNGDWKYYRPATQDISGAWTIIEATPQAA